MLQRIRRRKGKGFTLVELLVIVAIIGILAAVLMPRLLGYTERARTARAMSDLGSMKTIVEVYAADEGQGIFPATDAVKDVLTAKGIRWTEDETGIKDPWGNAYLYVAQINSSTNESQYIIASPGLDGTIGTADDVFCTDKDQPQKGAADTTTFGELGTDNDSESFVPAQQGEQQP